MDRATLIAAMEAAAAVKPVPVEVPTWGGTLHVRRLSVADMEEASGAEQRTDKRSLSRAAARVLCDENGQRLFDPSSDGDIDLIARQPWSVLQTILDAADKANGLTPDAVEQAGNG